MWNIKLSVGVVDEKPDPRMDKVRQYIASHGETTIYDARKGLSDLSLGTVFNCIKRLQSWPYDEIEVYRREKTGRGRTWYGLTAQGFCRTLIRFRRYREDFPEYARRWYSYAKFRQKPLGHITFDIRPYLEEKELADAFRDWIIYDANSWAHILGLSMADESRMADGFKIPSEWEAVTLTWESELPRHFNALGIPHGRLSDLYRGVPEVRQAIDKAVTDEVQRLHTLEKWHDELKQNI
jgi:hypothetical protein